jgi:uncharacterized protein YecE (DUF72 family)
VRPRGAQLLHFAGVAAALPAVGDDGQVGEILVGTASWTDKTLVSSGWYPESVNTAEKRLNYYAQQFPLVEVDSTYYAPPAEQTTRAWVERTPANFRFNVKAFSLLTGHPTKISALYQDLRPDTDKTNIYRDALGPHAYEDVWTRFLSALVPLAEAGKLGAILFQFPPWFTIKRANKDYLVEVRDRCSPLRAAVEFRNATWFDGDNRSETTEFLRHHDLPYVVVDMPQGHKSSVPAVVEATSNLAVVRLHGHSDKWDSHDVHQRFGYEYSEHELSDWTPRLRKLADQTGQTHVLMNNCYSDYAQRNARTLVDLLEH